MERVCPGLGEIIVTMGIWRWASLLGGACVLVASAFCGFGRQKRAADLALMAMSYSNDILTLYMVWLALYISGYGRY